MTHLRVDVEFDALERFISDGIAFLSTEGTVISWSTGAAAVTSIPRIDAVGKSLDQLFSRVEPPLGFAVVPEPITLWSNDEHRRPLHAMWLSIDEGWLLSFGREQRFASIEQLKSEIVAAVSHELRTPIATIKAYARTMLQNIDGLASERSEYLTTIEEQADRLGRAVDDLLLAGRVDAEHLLTKRVMVALDHVLDLAAERMGPSAAARLERHTNGVRVSCDPPLLADALSYLIDNALKFSPHSAPVVIEGETAADRSIIRVVDRGVGIASEHLPYIFERFYRADQDLASSTSGPGLGLFLALAIARAHGGSIAVSSTTHEGSTFTLQIPVRS